MEEKVTCPKCHVEVRTTDYFCFNCGVNLKPKPPSVSVTSQMILYTKSFLIPPFGILWAYPYLKQPNSKAKLVGVVAVVLTLVSLILAVYYTKVFVDSVNREINSQMQFLY